MNSGFAISILKKKKTVNGSTAFYRRQRDIATGGNYHIPTVAYHC